MLQRSKNAWVCESKVCGNCSFQFWHEIKWYVTCILNQFGWWFFFSSSHSFCCFCFARCSSMCNRLNESVHHRWINQWKSLFALVHSALDVSLHFFWCVTFAQSLPIDGNLSGSGYLRCNVNVHFIRILYVQLGAVRLPVGESETCTDYENKLLFRCVGLQRCAVQIEKKNKMKTPGMLA